MATPEKYLLIGPMPELKSLKKDELLQECSMWRKLWAYVPSDVKYYMARVGVQLAITMRNYKRYIGVLLGTYWDLKEIEIGTLDKVYDTRDGRAYFERKILRTRVGGLVDLQWIAERTPEEEFLAAEAEEAGEEPSPEALLK